MKFGDPVYVLILLIPWWWWQFISLTCILRQILVSTSMTCQSTRRRSQEAQKAETPKTPKYNTSTLHFMRGTVLVCLTCSLISLLLPSKYTLHWILVTVAHAKVNQSIHITIMQKMKVWPTQLIIFLQFYSQQSLIHLNRFDNHGTNSRLICFEQERTWRQKDSYTHWNQQNFQHLNMTNQKRTTTSTVSTRGKWQHK